MYKIEIELKDGKWLINNKPYQQLQGIEKDFFDKFLIEMKSIAQLEKQSFEVDQTSYLSEKL